MRPAVESTHLTPEDRCREVAAVLARGLLRLHARPAAACPAERSGPEKSPKILSELP